MHSLFHRQRGLSIGAFGALLVVLGITAFFAMKVIPMYMEFNAVKSAMNALAESNEQFESAKEIKDSLAKRFSTSYVDTVGRDDVEVTLNDSGGYDVSVDYEVEKPLVGNLTIAGHFEHSVQTK